MTPDKLATIAIIMILGIPILLGFGLASEDKEVTRETTERGGSLTDVALNSTAPYYNNYSGPNNNSMLQVDTDVGDALESVLTTPDFVQTSSNYSTVPVYNVVRGTMALNEVTTRTYEGGAGQTDYNYPVPTHTSYAYDVAQPLFFEILSNGNYADADATFVAAQPYMELQISGTYQVTITTAQNTSQSISTSGLLTVIKTNQASGSQGLSRLIVILSDDAQYEGVKVAIRLTGLGMDVWTSQLQSLSPAEGFLMTFGSSTPAVLRLDNDWYPLTNETRTSELIYADGEFTYLVNDIPTASALNAYIAAGRNAGIQVATDSGYGIGNIAADVTALPAFDYAYAYVTGTTATVYFDGSYYPVTAGSSGGFTVMKDTDDGLVVVLADNTMIRTGSLTIKLPAGTLHLLYRDTAALTSGGDQWNADLSGTATVRIDAGGVTTYHAYARIFGITKSYDTVSVLSSDGTETFTNVSSVGLALSAGNSFVDYTKYGSVQSYAQIQHGWRLPASTAITYDKWLNGYSNSYVRLMVDIPSGGDLYLYESAENTGQLLRVKNDSGMVTVTVGSNSPARLGSYSSLMIEYDSSMDTITVSGIKSWPSMGQYPEAVNQVKGDIDLDPTTGFYLAQVSGSLTFRVDAAKIQAGVYSTTMNYTLDLYAMFPNDDNQTIVIDSAGVYGSSLVIGGRTFDISGGNMTYDGETYRIAGAKIHFVRDGTSYNVTVGNMSWTSNTGSVYFGGEWSITMHREITTSSTTIESAWVPGKFALDTDGFVLAMVLTAGGAFVLLGMWGARSGSKIGILALVCGAAVVLGLVII